jgi:site-specific recombinase XerD
MRLKPQIKAHPQINVLEDFNHMLASSARANSPSVLSSDEEIKGLTDTIKSILSAHFHSFTRSRIERYVGDTNARDLSNPSKPWATSVFETIFVMVNASRDNAEDLLQRLDPGAFRNDMDVLSQQSSGQFNEKTHCWKIVKGFGVKKNPC